MIHPIWIVWSMWVVALVGCSGSATLEPGGPVEVTQGEVRVQVRSDPMPLQAGQATRLMFTVTTTDGTPLTGQELRPVVQLQLPTSYSILPFDAAPTDTPGEYIFVGTPPQAGGLQISVGINQGGVLTPLRLPEIPVLP